MVYFLPTLGTRVGFLLLLPVIWYSKKDYLWLAFFLILMDEPGGFFSGGTHDEGNRLPLFPVGPGFSLSIVQIYLILMFVKINVKLKKLIRLNIFISKELKYVAFLFFSLIFISFLIDISIDSLVEVFKITINLLFIFNIFYIIYNKNTLIKFYKIVFPFAFVALVFQIYGLTTGQQPVELFKSGAGADTYTLDGSSFAWLRPIEMVFTLFITFSGSLLLLGYRRHKLNSLYLLIVNGVSFLSIFLTGTRSWVIAFSLGYLIFFFNMKKQIGDVIFKLSLGVIFVIVLVIYNPTINKQFYNAWSRISSVTQLAEGDLSMGGTARRYQDYTPKIMESYKNSTLLFGHAFSATYFKNGNIHVGFHNILLNIGIIGVLIFSVLLLRIFFITYSREFHGKFNPMKLAIIPIFLLFVINTGVQVIGFGVVHSINFLGQAYTLALIVVAYNIRKEETLITQNTHLLNGE